jgi:YVTN family beta-propeller protein
VFAGRVDRRQLLAGSGAAALATLVAACAPAAAPTPTAKPAPPAAPPPPKPGDAPKAPEAPKPGDAAKAPEAPKPGDAAKAPEAPKAPETARAAAVPAGETVYVFNVGSKDVTLIEAATRKAVGTRPLGAQVRWLSNEQTYFDGQSVWTYDFPNNKLQAIAIDPKAVEVTKTIADIGTGPGHSLVVLPDKKKAIVNVAGDNNIAFLDLPSGKIDNMAKTGAFP